MRPAAGGSRASRPRARHGRRPLVSSNGHSRKGLRAMPAQIPIDSDGDSRMYWEGIAHGELRIQRCDACSRSVFYPRSICPHCFSDQLSWIAASGKGTIYAYTVVHQAFGAFAGDVPFIVAIVELEEGVRMMTRIIG